MITPDLALTRNQSHGMVNLTMHSVLFRFLGCGNVCYNGGTLDLTTCTCKCPYTFQSSQGCKGNAPTLTSIQYSPGLNNGAQLAIGNFCEKDVFIYFLLFFPLKYRMCLFRIQNFFNITLTMKFWWHFEVCVVEWPKMGHEIYVTVYFVCYRAIKRWSK